MHRIANGFEENRNSRTNHAAGIGVKPGEIAESNSARGILLHAAIRRSIARRA
jgi:hypothetical protein